MDFLGDVKSKHSKIEQSDFSDNLLGLPLGAPITSLRQSLPIQRPDVRNPNYSIGAKALTIYSADAFSMLAVMAAVRGHASAWPGSWRLGFLTPRTAATHSP